MNDINEITINDFVSQKSPTNDGLIVKSISSIEYIKTQIDLNIKERTTFDNLKLIIDNNEVLPDFCFINMDSNFTIDENDSGDLYRKTRGKTKLIFYNEKLDTLSNIDFYTFLGFMRLITI